MPKSASIALNPEPKAALGAIVTFTTDVPKNVHTPLIEVNAYDPETGALIYGQGGVTTDNFLLGGGSSQWLAQGGPAHCIAHLYSFDQVNGQTTQTIHATTTFEAAG